MYISIRRHYNRVKHLKQEICRMRDSISVYMHCSSIDIQERRKIEKELNELKEKFALLASVMPLEILEARLKKVEG